jgi:hypothetical protein
VHTSRVAGAGVAHVPSEPFSAATLHISGSSGNAGAMAGAIPATPVHGGTAMEPAVRTGVEGVANTDSNRKIGLPRRDLTLPVTATEVGADQVLPPRGSGAVSSPPSNLAFAKVFGGARPVRAAIAGQTATDIAAIPRPQVSTFAYTHLEVTSTVSRAVVRFTELTTTVIPCEPVRAQAHALGTTPVAVARLALTVLGAAIVRGAVFPGPARSTGALVCRVTNAMPAAPLGAYAREAVGTSVRFDALTGAVVAYSVVVAVAETRQPGAASATPRSSAVARPQYLITFTMSTAVEGAFHNRDAAVTTSEVGRAGAAAIQANTAIQTLVQTDFT